jgi:hypothetical protein
MKPIISLNIWKNLLDEWIARYRWDIPEKFDLKDNFLYKKVLTSSVEEFVKTKI